MLLALAEFSATPGGRFYLNIVNTSSEAVLLSDLVVRYWYTREPPVGWDSISCDWAASIATTSIMAKLYGNETVNIVDTLLVAQYSVGLNPSGFIALNADVNCSGTIDILDALIIAQYYVRLIESFQC